MKKISILLLFISYYITVLSQENDIYKTAINSYFKVSPFNISPDTLLKKILNDPDFVVDSLVYPTDTSRFFLSGYYKTFNPFSSQTHTVELLYYHAPVEGRETISDPHVLTYSLYGILNETYNNEKYAIEEEKIIFQNLSHAFPDWEYNKATRKAKYLSAYHKYKYGSSFPFYSAWGTWPQQPKKYCVQILVNMSALYHKRIER